MQDCVWYGHIYMVKHAPKKMKSELKGNVLAWNQSNKKWYDSQQADRRGLPAMLNTINYLDMPSPNFSSISYDFNTSKF